MNDDLDFSSDFDDTLRKLEARTPAIDDFKLVLVEQVGVAMDAHRLTKRGLKPLTGVVKEAHARIRRVKLMRCTVERLITILCAFGNDVIISMTIRPKNH